MGCGWRRKDFIFKHLNMVLLAWSIIQSTSIILSNSCPSRGTKGKGLSLIYHDIRRTSRRTNLTKKLTKKKVLQDAMLGGCKQNRFASQVHFKLYMAVWNKSGKNINPFACRDILVSPQSMPGVRGMEWVVWTCQIPLVSFVCVQKKI